MVAVQEFNFSYQKPEITYFFVVYLLVEVASRDFELGALGLGVLGWCSSLSYHNRDKSYGF